MRMCQNLNATKTNGYKDAYSRIWWDKPSPTITTKFYQYCSGRHGHPEQDRALSLREGALLQTFPENYMFLEIWLLLLVRLGMLCHL